jgi:hypothetical protein
LDGATYGSLAGVQRYLTMLTITPTSKPSTDEAAECAAAQYRSINSRLDTAGYTLPIADAGALELLADAENLLVAASLLERLIISLNPTPERVGVASVWREQAERILAPMVSGRAKIGPRTGGNAGIANAPSTFVDAALEEFIGAYGADS